jgi:hypothetical protein
MFKVSYTHIIYYERGHEKSIKKGNESEEANAKTSLRK